MRTNKFKRYLIIFLVAVFCFSQALPEAMAAPKRPARIAMKSVGSTDIGKIVVSWKKASKVTKYQVQAALNKKFTKGKQTKSVSSKRNSVTISGLKQGKKYYVRIRAYKTIQGKKYYGKWSKIKSVKVLSKKKTQDRTDQTDNSKDKVKSTKQDLSKLGLTIYSKYNNQDFSYTYTGKAVEPAIKVYNDTLYLIKDVDYTVSYTNNVNAGQATIIVTGIGKYTGSLTKQFEILKAYQNVKATIDNPIVYVGKTEKINISGAYGYLEFDMSKEGIVDISADGTITGLSSGSTYVYMNVSGDDNHNACIRYYLGKITVMQEEATSYGFHISSWSSKDTYKKQRINSRSSDGSNIYSIDFYCNSDERWLDNYVTFEVVDVTPTAYANMYADMGVAYVAPEMKIVSAEASINKIQSYGYSITINEPFTDNGPGNYNETATSGKEITIKAGASVRVVKLIAKKDGKVLDDIYLGSSGCDADGNYSAYDLNLYEQVRHRVEQKIWDENMSNVDKITAMAEYISKTTHYPGTEVTKKEYNPTFWENWSVDDTELFYNMFNDVILNRTMDLQGGIVTCLAAELLNTVATEDLGLPYLYDAATDEIAAGEGVWLVSGSYSSNPGNPYHYSLKYKYGDESTCLIDAQGMEFSAGSAKVTCEGHDCGSKIVSLK